MPSRLRGKQPKNFSIQKTHDQRVTVPLKNEAKKTLPKVWKSENKCYFCTRIDKDVHTYLLKSALGKKVYKNFTKGLPEKKK